MSLVYKYTVEQTISEKDVYNAVPVPDGYEVIDFRPPRTDEMYHNLATSSVEVAYRYYKWPEHSPRRILRKLREFTDTERLNFWLDNYAYVFVERHEIDKIMRDKGI